MKQTLKYLTYREIQKAIAELQANVLTSAKATGNNTAAVTAGEVTVSLVSGLPPGGTDGQVLMKSATDGVKWV